jgi:prepilin-type N-terminal cleavage/methylation domain-containing protein
MRESGRNIRNQSGFTIIELLIATAILSTILVLVTTMMVSIGSLYYKGLNQSRVQDDVRNIVDQVAQYVELGSSDPIPVSNGSTRAYCINDLRFTYVLYRKVNNQPGTYQHVLWRDTNPTPGSCDNMTLPNMNTVTPSPGGTELIAPNSRLTNFSISGTSPYSISVAVAYGDNDLLCDSQSPGDCSFPGVSPHMSNIISNAGSVSPSGPIDCKGTIGEQFCATSSLTTTVARRLTP